MFPKHLLLVQKHMVACKNSFDAKGLVRTLVPTIVRTRGSTLVRTRMLHPCAHHCAHHIFCMCTGHKVCTSYTLVRTLVRTFVRTLVRTMAWQNLVRTMPVAHVQGMVLQPDFRHKVCTSRGFLQMTIYIYIYIYVYNRLCNL